MNQDEKHKKRYQEWVKEESPNSPLTANCLRAFVGGGAICVLGQLLTNFMLAQQITEENARMFTAVLLVATAILLTGLGLYDKLGDAIKAGAAVPITGFANAIAAPAIEHKKEGFILGVGAKLFVIAGPVIVYGTLLSVGIGLVYWFFGGGGL